MKLRINNDKTFKVIRSFVQEGQRKFLIYKGERFVQFNKNATHKITPKGLKSVNREKFERLFDQVREAQNN